jgi:hypothetical protein
MTLQQSSLFFNITVLDVCPQLVSWHVEEENKINKCSIPLKTFHLETLLCGPTS